MKKDISSWTIIMSPTQQNKDLGDHNLADNTLVDFCCMNKGCFTLKDCAEYHGIPVDWYKAEHIEDLARQGLFSLVKT